MTDMMGPFEIVEPIKGPPARGGLNGSVEFVEPSSEGASELDRAERRLVELRAELSGERDDESVPDLTRRQDLPPVGEAADRLRDEIRKAEAERDVIAKRYAAARRWENGYTYRPFGGCAEANTWAPCSGELKRDDPTAPIVEVVPFTVYAGFTCSTWAMEENERIAHAEIRLAARESQAVEDELWHGTIAAAMGYPNPVLASPAATALTVGAATSPLPWALASLQEAVRGCLGSEVAAVIHATPKTVTMWQTQHLINLEPDGRLRDIYGNVIVAGAGYDGSSPTGDVDATGRTAWAYATGPVRVMAGPVYITPDDTDEALTRDTNDLTWRAERSMSAAFDPCCLYGINVDLCGLTCP